VNELVNGPVNDPVTALVNNPANAPVSDAVNRKAPVSDAVNRRAMRWTTRRTTQAREPGSRA
jgi:hypothetical protein